MFSDGIDKIARTDIAYRYTLPVNMLDLMGSINSEKTSDKKNMFTKKVNSLVEKFVKNMSIDDGVDQMAKEYLNRRQPPVLTGDQKLTTKFDKDTLTLETEVRFISKNAVRMIVDNDEE
jgi:hypothetical protein